MTDSKALITVTPVNDPVIAMKRRKLEAIERVAKRFKRIDINFLTVAKPGEDKPAFAILPVDKYERGEMCMYNGNLSGFNDGLFRDVLARKTNLHGIGTATPNDTIPDEGKAILSEVKNEFDQVMVAWEAEWVVTPTGDPLVIGEIDNVWFLLYKWNTTDLESYIAGSVS